MFLIADSGSTKCDWVLLDGSGKMLLKTTTKGLNPSAISGESIAQRLAENADLKSIKNQVEKVHFYGAGCGTETPKQRLGERLKDFFSEAKEVNVSEDLTAAVHAVTTEPGVVCILGTGSNSCYFDGENISTKIPSMGYTLMDEASGNYFGKRLLRDYYFEKMPKETAEKFENTYDLSPDVVKENLYNKENPRSYLGGFAEFVFRDNNNPYFRRVLAEGFKEFIELHILCYEEAKNRPIHFVGSIAFYAKENIREALAEYQLEMGNIIQRPIDGLIGYYQKNIINL
jgi:N-acetylglucosamine kinase-like BadF-type ATPase